MSPCLLVFSLFSECCNSLKALLYTGAITTWATDTIDRTRMCSTHLVPHAISDPLHSMSRNSSLDLMASILYATVHV